METGDLDTMNMKWNNNFSLFQKMAFNQQNESIKDLFSEANKGLNYE